MSVRIGVIGCGKIANKHFSAYKKIDDTEVVATDIDPEKREKVERHGFEWAESVDSLLDSDLDGVDICTPVSTHNELIERALNAGNDVFCEKPLAESEEDARDIQAKAQASPNSVMVGYLYRYHPAFQFAQSVLKDNIIGEPYYAIFRVGGRGSASVWKHKASMGGGVANEMLVHMLDLISWYFDDIETARNLHSKTILNEREVDGETIEATAIDTALLELQTSCGVDVICQSDLITPSYMNYVEIQGTNGSLFTTILDYFPTFVYCEEPRGIFDRGHNYREFDRTDLFEKELSEFVATVANGDDPQWDSVQDSVNIHRIIDESLR
jgi:predicted dehydrogenase